MSGITPWQLPQTDQRLWSKYVYFEEYVYESYISNISLQWKDPWISTVLWFLKHEHMDYIYSLQGVYKMEPEHLMLKIKGY